MSKYIIIKADINDADYVTEKTKITEEEIIKIKQILDKMPNNGNSIDYKTGELGNDDEDDSEYNYITNEEKNFLSKFLPSGEYNYSGIHTIESVEIVEVKEKLL